MYMYFKLYYFQQPKAIVNSVKVRVHNLQSRAVVFGYKKKKTVILPPNPVGFRLTYTQL